MFLATFMSIIFFFFIYFHLWSSEIIQLKDVFNLKRPKVPVDLFVMSKCPDAVFCELIFNEVVEKVGHKIELDMNFIATLNSSEPKFGITCKHGESECLGNIQELCAKKISPNNWFKFVLCLNKDVNQIGLSTKITYKCLKQVKIPAKRFESCVKEDGIPLLKTSLSISNNLQMRESCTILINKGEHKCIHNQVWKECDDGHEVKDFIRQIEEAYSRKQIVN